MPITRAVFTNKLFKLEPRASFQKDTARLRNDMFFKRDLP